MTFGWACTAPRELTTTIELGPGVLIPTQRHPLVNAAQTVSLHRLAPGRVIAAFGTGFSSRAAIGQPPIPWSYMEAYIRAYHGLLAGQVVDWEGAPIKLMLTSAQADALPLRIPLLVAAIGPKQARRSQTNLDRRFFNTFGAPDDVRRAG